MGLMLDNFNFFNTNKDLKNKKFILFGAGIVAKKFINNFDKSKILYLVDNNKKLWKTEFENFKVQNPNVLKKIQNKNIIVIIMTTSFMSVIDQIKYLNKSIEVSISHYLKDLIHIEYLQNLKKKILVSSGLPSSKFKLSGGGLYEIDLDGQNWSIKKVYSGTIHGVIKYNKGFAISDSTNGIILLDKNYKLIHKGKYSLNTRAHGIAFNSYNNLFYVACSNTDQIKIFNKKLEYVNSISISDKYEMYKTPQHHINDLFIKDNFLYVSMFSLSGNHKRNIYDGGVLEIDLCNETKRNTIFGDLFMPHSIKFIKDSFFVLDSLRGGLIAGSQNIALFTGFSRGLSFDGDYFYVGQSRNRNFSIINQQKNNISIDNSILIYDSKNKFSRNIYLPNTISEIHEVLTL
ncbi:MAG: hypothetical protein CBD35_06515 [Verrucomicrobia bacterium TMED175]|nr:MAG: hypothetical protein CBD35_06515 [Verrucomicrobia bacterium TMED175]